MKTSKNILSVILLLVFSILFFASTSVKTLHTTENTYVKTKKDPKDITISYNLPVITPTATTQQMQAKGGVVISAEIIPFSVSRQIKSDREVTYADPTKKGYDVYEITKTPNYSVSPENVQFKIRIRNNEQVPLVLSQVGFVLAIDGIMFSFPTEYLEEWSRGLILTGFEKDYLVRGPQLEGLHNAQVIRLFLNGVPTSYDQAGSITRKENFEWFFECKNEKVEKEEQLAYAYETAPIETRKCAKCSGTGRDPQPYKCSNCDGKGSYVSAYDKKVYKCSKCEGTGRVYNYCDNCSGVGILSFPKSQPAPIATSISWHGAQVEVITNPPGAKISVVNTKTGEYYGAGMSNMDVNWYSSNQKSYPIVVEYQGQTIKILPYDEKGKLISKVQIDFLGSAFFVKKGRAVN